MKIKETIDCKISSSVIMNIHKKERFIKSKVSINENLSKANKDGYYLSSNSLARFDLDYLCETLGNWGFHDVDDFNKRLENIIDNSIEDIKNDIIENIHERSEIIKSIFRLYKSHEYYGMITLALSQIDGIMKGVTISEGFFATSEGNPKYLDKEIYIHFMSSGEQLQVDDRNDYELLAKESTDGSKFNRHSILHGESIFFGHKLNAIKSILLLDFISEIHYANQPVN